MMSRVGYTHPEEWLKSKHSPFFQDNPQNSGPFSDFKNIFIQQTKQFLCTSNCLMKGLETNKIKKEKQRDRGNSHHFLLKKIKKLRKSLYFEKAHEKKNYKMIHNNRPHTHIVISFSHTPTPISSPYHF